MSAIVHGDCREVMRAMEGERFHAIATDPPYSLGFMGKSWDKHDSIDAAFGYWLAGFTDGEGCFRVQRHERGTHTCAFQIKLRRDDRAILERIRRFIGYGSLNDQPARAGSKEQACLVVQCKEGCARVVEIFARFPLRAKKLRDFLAWADAVHEWTTMERGNRWRGQGDYERLARLKERIENARAYREVPWSGNGFQDFTREWAEEALRVAKPGAHLVAFGGTRTYHRLACGLEDAGWELRDSMMWLFGSGFPKSHNLEGDFSGFGTALKPAFEPIILARKPLVGTVAQNVLEHGCGAINVDGCRVGTSKSVPWSVSGRYDGSSFSLPATRESNDGFNPNLGRWPANVILGCACEVEHDPACAVAMLDAQSGEVGAFAPVRGSEPSEVTAGIYGGRGRTLGAFHADAGGASRFFYVAKATREERERWLQETSDGSRANRHPTVKPVALMRWLVRLVGGKRGSQILDPFCGSGTTAVACALEGFDCTGIELDEESVETARGRLLGAIEESGALTAEHEPAAKSADRPMQLGLLGIGAAE